MTDDPCAATLPVWEGAGVEVFIDVYAVIDGTSPSAISVEDDGTVFAGNAGDLANPATTELPILRIADGAPAGGLARIGSVSDPDFLTVDTAGGFACSAGNVLVGGVLLVDQGGTMVNVGQLTELDPDTGAEVEATIDEDTTCIGNASGLLMSMDGSLLIANQALTPEDTVASVCRLERESCEVDIVAEPLIVGRESNVLTWGLVESPEGTLYVTRREEDEGGGGPVNNVYVFDETVEEPLDPEDQLDFLVEGYAAAYGPPGPFEGLLVRKGDGRLVRVDEETGDEQATLLTGIDDPVGNYLAFSPSDPNAFYISQVERRRILRVGTTELDPASELGCDNGAPGTGGTAGSGAGGASGTGGSAGVDAEGCGCRVLPGTPAKNVTELLLLIALVWFARPGGRVRRSRMARRG